MSDPLLSFMRRILWRQVLVAVGGLFIILTLSPRLLALESDVAESVQSTGTLLSMVAFTIGTLVSIIAMRRHRRVVRALSAGTGTIEPAELGRFAELPATLTTAAVATAMLCASLIFVPGLRPDKLDDGRAVSLFVLAVTIVGATSIPYYVLIRQATLGLVELCPLEPLMMHLEMLELKGTPWRRLISRVLLAVVAPVVLMGVGAALVAHAHLRTLTEQSRRTTAVLIARTALEPGNGAHHEAGRADAIEAAAEFGFLARVEPTALDTSEPSSMREPDGQIAVTAPLDEGHAIIRFSADLSPEDIRGSVGVGLAALLIAAALAALFGRAFADDLLQATRSVRLLGTENVLRGQSRLARPARFGVVDDLGRAIEALTERFRVFAAAQERALEARATAQRMRGLLFASVSHDLKSPLNAILGFADLVAQEDLTPAQEESLSMIRKRGRELLALIETILDAARVEAGQLELVSRRMAVSRLVFEARRLAHELASDADTRTLVAVEDQIPMIPVDPTYATRALSVIVAHALRTASADAVTPTVQIRATLPASPGGRVCIDVEYGSRSLSRDELERLFARRATSRGRGLTLGLNLARSVIELHGGSVDVYGEKEGAPVCRVWMPLDPPMQRPKLSSFPTLG